MAESMGLEVPSGANKHEIATLIEEAETAG
jgi:hypothetical protein